LLNNKNRFNQPMNVAQSGWFVPVLAILTLQTLSAFLSRLIPIVGPVIASDYGWASSSIGYMTASNALGGLAMLMVGSALIRKVGGIRMLQLVLLLGAVSMVLFLYPNLAVAFLVCFAMGFSNGMSSPAGSDVLQRFSTPARRNLMFSIKQAGVPFGGMVAGLLVPVTIAFTNWPIALLICGILVCGITLTTWRLSPILDYVPGRNARTSLASSPGGSEDTVPASRSPVPRPIRILAEPLTSLLRGPGLLRMAIVGSLFAVSQSCWFAFTVVYLIERHDYSLALAGLVFSVMQIGAIFGRLILGWLSDILSSAKATLIVASIVAALTTVLLGLSSAQWPLWVMMLLALVAGCSVAGWNGVQIAEMARLSPPGLVAETSAGSAILYSFVHILAPTAFAAFVFATGRYDIAFIALAVFPLLVAFVVPRKRSGRASTSMDGGA